MDSIDLGRITPGLRPLCHTAIYLDASSPGALGASPFGSRQAHYVRDGWFRGERLRGQVLPGGGDWPLVGTDALATNKLDVRVVWKTDDGALIYLEYGGRIATSPAAAAQVAAGTPFETLDPSDYYFRTTPTFQTGDERYDWLNGIVAVGYGRAIPGGVGYVMFELL